MRRASRVRPIERRKLKKKKVDATKKIATDYSYESKLKEPVKNDYLPLKRLFDILSASGLMVATSPIVLLFGILVKMETPGKMFYTQERVGYMGKRFKVTKLRSMYTDAEKNSGAVWASKNDSRVTKVGKFIRAHSLDELPQIWDIFVGNMSVIGPRPALWNQDLLTAERDKYDANDVKPGLTGWAQINGRDELEIGEKAKLDGEYVKKISFPFDVKCFARTIFSVAKSDGVVEGGTGEIHKKEQNK